MSDEGLCYGAGAELNILLYCVQLSANRLGLGPSFAHMLCTVDKTPGRVGIKIGRLLVTYREAAGVHDQV